MISTISSTTPTIQKKAEGPKTPTTQKELVIALDKEVAVINKRLEKGTTLLIDAVIDLDKKKPDTEKTIQTIDKGINADIEAVSYLTTLRDDIKSVTLKDQDVKTINQLLLMRSMPNNGLMSKSEAEESIAKILLEAKYPNLKKLAPDNTKQSSTVTPADLSMVA